MHGQEICIEIQKDLNIPLKFNCIEETLLQALKNNNEIKKITNIFPIHLYLRESWLDL
jgi:hypothetical protein